MVDKPKLLPPYVVRNKENKVVCRINRQTKQGEYFLHPKSGSRDFVSKILLSGFTTLPTGLRRSGYGLTTVGYRILRALFQQLETFELTIDKNAESTATKSGQSYRVILKHADLTGMLDSLRRIGGEKFREQNLAIAEALFGHFPKVFSKPEKDTAYRAGDLAALLANKATLKKLSPKDVDTLGSFLPGFLNYFGSTIKAPKKLLALSETRNAAEIIYLDKIIKEFERRLKQKTQNENSWQEFLREYILIFNTNYASSLEKESIALQGKYPDFLLIDAYNYLDIYEIKKPNTQLLKKDESRGNYYWDVEIAKAISQVENYIAYADRHGSVLREDIKKRKDIDIRVLKPRGFIIAGQRSQLQGEIMEDNFRLLNSGLKNLEIILYDELLDNLRTFLKRLKTA
jgi:hypothetical protein